MAEKTVDEPGQKFLRESYEDWLNAKGVIEKFLVDLGLRMSSEEFDHKSSALLARLAHADLLVVRPDHMKDNIE